MFKFSVSQKPEGSQYPTHLFTIETDREDIAAARLLRLLTDRFPATEGFTVSLTEWKTVGTDLPTATVLAELDALDAKRKQEQEDREQRERILKIRRDREEADRQAKVKAKRIELYMPLMDVVQVGYTFTVETAKKVLSLTVATIDSTSRSVAWLNFTDTEGRSWEYSDWGSYRGRIELKRIVFVKSAFGTGRSGEQRRDGGKLLTISNRAGEAIWDTAIYEMVARNRERQEAARR
jgi:hypothetical protein